MVIGYCYGQLSIQHQASNILHQASNILHQASKNNKPGSKTTGLVSSIKNFKKIEKFKA